MLSVIIPVYNAAPYLSSCLDSLLACSGEDLEVIVVDDGSQDDSGRICDEYAERDKRVTVFHQANKGVSAARNLGLEHAHGEWISFVDADDEVLPGYVEACLHREHPADVAYFAHEGYELKEWVCRDRADIETCLLELKRNNQGFEFYGYTWNKFFRASIIREHGLRFPIELNHREDEFFTTEYIHFATSVEVLPAPLYRYRMDNNGAHLTHRRLSVNTLWQLAQTQGKQVSYWTASKELRRYEVYRALYTYCDALLQADLSIGGRVVPEICRFAKQHRNDIDPQQYPYGFVNSTSSVAKLLLWWLKRKVKLRK